MAVSAPARRGAEGVAAHRDRAEHARGRASGIGNDGLILSGITAKRRSDAETCALRAADAGAVGERRAVELPLIAQRLGADRIYRQVQREAGRQLYARRQILENARR